MRKLSAKSDLAVAFNYTIKRPDALSRFLADAPLEIDNNIAENALRGVALGRKNYLFAGRRGPRSSDVLDRADGEDERPQLRGLSLRHADQDRRGAPDQPDRGTHAVERKVITMVRPSQPSFGGMFGSQPQHRLFFGIWPDAQAAESLTQLMARLRNDGIMPGRPVDTDRLHLTLHHLGDFVDQIPPSLLPTAQAAAAAVKVPPLEVAFDRIGGTRGQFLLRASDGSLALRHFRQILSIALIKEGLRRYVDPAFTPHVTLSYDFSDAPEMSIEPIAWTVHEFVLVESLLRKHRHIKKGSWQI